MVYRAKVTRIQAWVESHYNINAYTMIHDAKDVYIEVKNEDEAELLESINKQQEELLLLKAQWYEDHNDEPKFKYGDRVRNKKSGLEQTLGSCIEDVYEGAFPFRIKDQDDWELVEQESDWSDNDNNAVAVLRNIIKESDIINSIIYTNPLKEKLYDWLKSIKDRVLPQPKQKWKQENTDDLTDFENAMMHIGGSFFGDNAGLDPNDTNAIKEQANILLKLVPSKKWSEEDKRILYNVKAYIGYAIGQRGVKDELFKEANEWLNSLPIGFIYNKNYNEDMVTLLVGELEQIAKDNNAPLQYQAEINWLKSLRPQNKTYYWTENEIKYAISDYIRGAESYEKLVEKLRCLKPKNQWKPSDEQMLAINTAINVLGKGTINGKYLIELHEQLKKLREE